MNKVAYILGAGFSAPLGVPVMRDFLFKSKDLYFSDTSKYEHFSGVFQGISQLSIIKNYYDSDLFNIEEILSILEMSDFLKGRKLKKQFIEYIKDVVNYYTPVIQPFGKENVGNWQDWVFGNDKLTSNYGYFVASLLRLILIRKRNPNFANDWEAMSFLANVNSTVNSRYAVLSLNYDLVIENFVESISKEYKSTECHVLRDQYNSDWKNCALLKLHGSADDESIVPPTWAKGTHKKIVPAWKSAFRILRDANHLRFVGYSLPLADSYVKYLLKAAVVSSQHLKSIDVICLDFDGSTEQRYDEFFRFSNYRFKNHSTTGYLELLSEITKKKYVRNVDTFAMSFLENAHEQFMATT